MTDNEICLWNSKLNLLENTEQLQVSLLELRQAPISFYEALAIYMAEGSCKSQTSEFSVYNYQHLAAA